MNNRSHDATTAIARRIFEQSKKGVRVTAVEMAKIVEWMEQKDQVIADLQDSLERVRQTAMDMREYTDDKFSDWDESRIDVIGQNGNDGHHYELENLPLMARQEWMGDAIGAMREDPGRHDWEFYYEGNQSLMLQEASEGLEVYRIADTDEHGLSVVERTADMPEGAKYRGWTERTRDWTYYVCFIEKHAHNRFERIEDYQPPAQESGDD